jgi:hypothetical protein
MEKQRNEQPWTPNLVPSLILIWAFHHSFAKFSQSPKMNLIFKKKFR